MFYVKIKKNSYQKRLNIIAKRRKYLSIKSIKTLISGPLTDKNGDLMNSSFLTVEASSKNEIKLFQINDLILKAGIWDEIIS